MRFLVYDVEGEDVITFDTLGEAKIFVLEEVTNPSDYGIVDTDLSIQYHTYDEGLSWVSTSEANLI